MARSPFTDDSLPRQDGRGRPGVRQGATGTPAAWDSFAQRLTTSPATPPSRAGWRRCEAWLRKARAGGRPTALLPVRRAGPVRRHRRPTSARRGWLNARTAAGGGSIIEKPFGHDLASARDLNRRRPLALPRGPDLPHRPLPRQGDGAEHPRLPLRQHALRAAVELATTSTTCRSPSAEKVTVGGRGDYYDQAGVLRDMFQNHLLQLLTLVAMEAPGAVRRRPAPQREDEGARRRPLPTPEEAGRQLVPRPVRRLPPGEGRRRRTRGRRPSRRCELHIDNWRWRGVPFYLRSGKGLKQRLQRGGDPVPLPAAPDVPAAAGHDAAVQPAGAVHPAGRGHPPELPDQGAGRGRRWSCGRRDLEFHYQRRLPGQADPGGVRAAAAGRACRATRRCSCGATRSSGPGRSWTRSSQASASDRRPQPEEYAVGSEGPAGADASWEGRAGLAVAVPSLTCASGGDSPDAGSCPGRRHVSVKAAVLDVPSGRRPVPSPYACQVDRPTPEAAEVPAERLWSAVTSAARQAMRGIEAVDGVGLSCLTPALVLLDGNDRPLAPIWTHLDRRASAGGAAGVGGGRRGVPGHDRQPAPARRHLRRLLPPDPPRERPISFARFAAICTSTAGWVCS